MRSENLNQALISCGLGFHPVNERLTPEVKASPRDQAFAVMPALEYLPDGVRLNYYAPGAQTVEVAGWGGGAFSVRREMALSSNEGYWSLDVHGLAPGLYYHDFFVNGVRALNDTGAICYAGARAVNFFEVPDPDFDMYLLRDVPHGVLHMRLFHSSESGTERNCWVYTPPGYDTHPEKRYPVLYLQHGGGENETAWIWQGKINYILDNMIALGQCPKMLVVMNDGSVLRQEGGTAVTYSVARMVGEDCVPFIDSTYRTIPKRCGRAVAGLSMGGLYAKQIAFENPGLFGSLGVFSSGAGFQIQGMDVWGNAYDYSGLFLSPSHYQSLFELTFVTCGEDDPRHVYTAPQVKRLAEDGFPVEYHSYPGGHEWHVWRKSVCDMLRKVFRSLQCT